MEWYWLLGLAAFGVLVFVGLYASFSEMAWRGRTVRLWRLGLIDDDEALRRLDQ